MEETELRPFKRLRGGLRDGLDRDGSEPYECWVHEVKRVGPALAAAFGWLGNLMAQLGAYNNHELQSIRATKQVLKESENLS